MDHSPSSRKSPRSLVLVLAAALVALVATGAACSPPKAGGKCSAGQAACTDGANALTCGADGKFTPMTCRGAKGCTKAGSAINCDDSIAQENDGCDEENEVACSVDKKSALECHGNKFVVGETCKGAKACNVDGDKIQCDNDISDIGDPCHFIGDFACATDKSFALKCIDHKMAKLNSCRGAKGCQVVELPAVKKIEFLCDDSLAQLGDECDEDGEHACAMDKKSIYVCKASKFTAFKPCEGPKGCSFDEKGEKFECDATATAGKTVDVTKPQPGGMPQKPKKK
jgi:hypothetical protein